MHSLQRPYLFSKNATHPSIPYPDKFLLEPALISIQIPSISKIAGISPPPKLYARLLQRPTKPSLPNPKASITLNPTLSRLSYRLTTQRITQVAWDKGGYGEN